MVAQAKRLIFLIMRRARPLLYYGNKPKPRQEVKLMTKFWFIAAAPLVSGWLTVVQAQNWVDSHPPKAVVETQERYRSNLDSDSYNNSSYSGNVNLHSVSHGAIEPNLFLDRYNQPHNGGSGANSNGPVYNPYTIRW
jgi:hypothetical protein